MKFSLTKFAVLLAGAFVVTTSDLAVSAATSDHRMKQFVLGSSQSRTVETGENETAEVILVDGTSVVIAPGSLVTVITSKDQPIAIRVERGTLRVTGGLSNRTQNISIMTPHALLSLKSGSAFIQVGSESTRTHLLNGKEILVSSGGRSQTIYRTGFQIVASNGRTSAPRRMSTQDIVNDLNSLSRGLQTGTTPRLGSTRGSSSGVRSEQLTEDASGSDEDVQIAESVEEVSRLDNAVGFDTSANELGNTGSEPIDQGSPNPTPSADPIDFSFDLAGGGFSPSTGETSTQIVEYDSTTVDTNRAVIRQNFSDGNFPDGSLRSRLTEEIFLGPTTNRAFPTEDVTIAIDSSDVLTSLTTGDGSRAVGYYYGTASSGLVAQLSPPTPIDTDSGVVRFDSLPLGRVSTNSIYNVGRSFLRADTTFGAEPIGESPWNPETGERTQGIWHQGTGVIVEGINYGTQFDRAIDPDIVPRAQLLDRRDNFIFLDMDLVASFNWNCVSTDCPGGSDGTIDEADTLSGLIEAIENSETSDGQRFVFDAERDIVSVRPFSGTSGIQSGDAAALVHDPSETRRFVFAAGDLDQVIENRVPGESVDRFHLAAGMGSQLLAANRLSDLTAGMDLSDGDRAFFRGETWLELDDDFSGSTFSLDLSQLAQSDLLIINPDGPIIVDDGEPAPNTSKLLYADLGIRNDAEGRQVSTISATIGEVRYRFTSELNGGTEGYGNDQIVDALIFSRAIGSTRGINSSGTSKSPVLLYSDFQSTAAGGGNPNIGSPGSPTPGRLGFFVLENTGMIFDDVEARGSLGNGFESPVGSTDGLEPEQIEELAPVQYAALRLGVATGTEALPGNRTGFGFVPNETIGYAVGLVDVETPGGSTIRPMGNPDLLPNTDVDRRTDPNLRFSNFDAASNSFQVEIDGLILGGEGGASAYVSDTEFGARSTDGASDAALISGGLVAEGIGGSVSSTTNGYEHVKWGFFFGDIDTGMGSGSREHVHLGTFAAGNELSGDETDLINASVKDAMDNGLSTTVRYSGHAIGNVVMGGIVSTQTGTFSDTFNFGSRTGQAELSIGGATVAGNSSLALDDGFDSYTSFVTGSGGISGELNGSFVGAVEHLTVGGGTLIAPGGLVGGFALSDGVSGGFRAVGSFAGE